MKRAIVFAVSVQVWTGCVAVPDGGDEPALFDASVESELVLDGGSIRPPVGEPYRGPQCATNPPAGDAGYQVPRGGSGGGSMNEPGDGDGDPAGGAGVGGSGGGDPEQPMTDAGAMAMPGMPRPERAGDVLITEIMFDPKGRPDTDGEWIELWNAGSEALSLEGCALDDGASTPRKLDPFVIEADGYATLGRGPEAGFAPDVVVALALTNSSDTVALLCDGVEIDRVSYDGTFPLRAGASLSLDPAFATALEDDDPASWCLGTFDYGGDLGTPGTANPSCAAADAGAP